MYKVKIAFLSKNSKDEMKWSSRWIDWNGIDDNSDNIREVSKIEGELLKKNDPSSKIIHTLICGTQQCDDGKYMCGSCENYFEEPEDGHCPYCGSGNFVEGSVDEPLKPNKMSYSHCPKCDATDPDIQWGEKEWYDTGAYQEAYCGICGCSFREYYDYSGSEIVDENLLPE